MLFRKLRRATSVSTFLVWALTLGLMLPPPSAYALPSATVTSSPAKELGLDQNRTIILLRDEDTYESASAALIAQARAKGLTRVRVLHVQGQQKDPRLELILRELSQAGLTLETNLTTTADFEAEVVRAGNTNVSVDYLNEVIASTARQNGETPATPGWLGTALSLPGKALKFGLFLPSWVLGKFISTVTGQRYKSMSVFVLEQPEPINRTVFRSCLWTTIIAVAMIWVTQFVIGPRLIDDPSMVFSQAPAVAKYKLLAISTFLFAWILTSLTLMKGITNWKDQVVRVRYDKDAPPGSQISLIPSLAVNFGLTLYLETMLNLILPSMDLGIDLLWNGVNETTLGSVVAWSYKLFWAPIIAVASVFSFFIPANIFGRGLKYAEGLVATGDPAKIREGERRIASISALSFVFWTALGCVFNAARFFPDQAELLWIPLNKWPLLSIGLGFVGFEYGRSILSWGSRLFSRGIAWLRGAPKAPKQESMDPIHPCTLFVLGDVSEPEMLTLAPTGSDPR